MTVAALREALLARAPSTAMLGDRAQLDEQLHELWSRAQRRWPGVGANPQRFGAALAERLAEPMTLGDLRTDDLYLVVALLDGAPEALSAFEGTYGIEIDRGLRRLDPEGFDDLRQTVRQRLLVGDGERPPKLASYGARGELLRWLRVTVVRLRAEVARRLLRAPEPDVDVLDSVDPEAYAAELRVAFASAVEELRPKQRNLLRQHLLGGLSATQLAGLYNVDRSTAKRWLSRAREELWGHTRYRVMQQLQLSGDQFGSIIRLVHSELQLSIPRLLGSEDSRPADPRKSPCH